MTVVRDLRAWGKIPLLLIVAVLCPFSYGGIVYVDADAVGAHDGTSWTDAYACLQEALASASELARPVEIRVAQGVYRPDRGSGQTPGDPQATFGLINGVALKGGFAGLETPDPNARDVGLYRSTLSGLIGAQSASFRHSSFVVTGQNTDRSAVLDGFTVSAGGGGMLNDHSSPTVIDCTFSENSVFTLPGAVSGGGMVNVASSPTLIGCTFSRNVASHGGGMYNEASNPTLTQCIFSENSARYVGGAMENSAANPILTNCIFKGNSAGHYGGAMCNTDSAPALAYCTFAGNSADGKGGGMYNVRSGPILTCCILWSNSAASGPALFDDAGSSTTVTYSDIQDGWPGDGNLDADPFFADPDNGDLHLRSPAGRWDPAGASWVIDDVTSLCIDAGDPKSSLAFEPFPNGGLVNMGAYGGTTEASKSPSSVHGTYGSGAGEPNDPYVIYTAEHMNAIGAHPNDWDKHFKLVADIDLSQCATGQFNLIGTDKDNAFTGLFDGGAHTISNLAIDSDAGSGVGLFGYVSGSRAEIKDVGLIDPQVNAAGTDYVGALVGYLSEATVANCFVQGGTVSGDRSVGGVVGYNRGGTVTRSSSTGRVSGTENVGGLTGYNDGAITRCYAGGSLAGQANAAGGLIGQNNGTLTDCYASTTVAGGDRVGGLVGKNAGAITCCYCTGSVTANRFAGGLLGSNVGGGATQVVACLWDVQSSGLASMCGLGSGGDGGCGKTTAEMQTAGTFLEAGWDLVGETDNGAEEIWWILEGQGYPCLWWERSE